MPKIYNKLLFDLDNTLIDDDENRKYAITKILIGRKEKITDEKIENFIRLDDQFWKDRAEGKIKNPYIFKTNEEKTEWIRAERFIRFFKYSSFEEARQINNEYINYLRESIIPIKNSKEILKYLYKKSMKYIL